MEPEMSVSWPDDADGDVLRDLAAEGFDYGADVTIEFNVDLDDWPPAERLVKALSEQFGDIEAIPPDDGDEGYLLFSVKDRLSYELVTSVQRSVSELAAPFNGRCESWGILV